jgi:cytidylate kinase
MSATGRVIAIDGPAASGKSTVARRVAEALGWSYADSGALYRGIAWRAVQEGIRGDDPAGIARLAERVVFDLFVDRGAIRFRIDGRAVGDEIRSAEVNAVVSPVAAVPDVRRKVVKTLREMTRFGHLVMEGRDIGTAVFPEADGKFYLDASPEERARRRHAEETRKGSTATVAQVGVSLSRRDTVDSSRKMDPLRVASDAVVIDSTGMGVDDVVRAIVERFRDSDSTVAKTRSAAGRPEGTARLVGHAGTPGL